MALDVKDSVVPGVKQAAFFDLEKTITLHAVEQEAAVEFYRRREVPLSMLAKAAYIYLKYDLGLMKDFEAMKRYGATSFRGRRASRDVELFEDYFQRHLKHFIYPEARRLIDDFQDRGFVLCIVSATYLFMVEPFAKLLNVSRYLGTQLELTDGVCTGQITGTIYHQANKARAVEEIAEAEGIDLAHSYAFGDSTSDRAMLERVGHPVAVNPNRKLKRIAAERGWRIERWTR